MSVEQKGKKVSRFYCPSMLLFPCTQDTVKKGNNNDQSIKTRHQSIKTGHHPCSAFPSKKISRHLPAGCPHSCQPVSFYGGTCVTVFVQQNSRTWQRARQTLVAVSPLIPAVSPLPCRCLSFTVLAAEFCSKRMTKAAIGTKPSFLLDSLLLPAVPHVGWHSFAIVEQRLLEINSS